MKSQSLDTNPNPIFWSKTIENGSQRIVPNFTIRELLENFEKIIRIVGGNFGRIFGKQLDLVTEIRSKLNFS